MNGKITIKYWWKCSKFKKILVEFHEILAEEAWYRIKALKAEGYIEGELNCDIDGNDFRGYWSIKENTK